MWEKIKKIDPKGIAAVKQFNRGKLYADEDIEIDAVDYLRDQKVNVLTVAEADNKGKPDSFQAAFAFRKQRLILTKNAKDYLDNRKLPFHRTYGVLAIEAKMQDWDAYFNILDFIIDMVIPHGEMFRYQKLHIADGYVTRTRLAKDSKLDKAKFRYRPDSWYLDIWKD